MRELEEFCAYVEMPDLKAAPERFEGVFGGGECDELGRSSREMRWEQELIAADWMTASDQSKRQFIEEQLEYLESPRYDKRRLAQQSLLYLLLGALH